MKGTLVALIINKFTYKIQKTAYSYLREKNPIVKNKGFKVYKSKF